jgi:demethylmenaquinone methyltransferase/2-methoxy-6-polyprenyl-1,4-benzoquinol methylase
MFDTISPRYDLLNRLLSLGMDASWRRALARQLPQGHNLEILDLATGTADVLLTMCRENANITSARGIDRARKMLDIGQAKIEKAGLDRKIILSEGDANKIPFEDRRFDAVSISFGIRNVEDPRVVLGEMFRVLKPGGKALILEFSLPKNRFIRAGHLFYLRQIVPLAGHLVAGNYRAYKYLNQTIEQFPYGDAFENLMIGAGFTKTRTSPLLFGAASVYRGERPAP